MTLQGGDREFGHGDQITVENTSGDSISEGELLVVTGYNTTEDRPEVQPANSGDEDDYHCVAGDAIADGGYGQGHFQGAVWVRADSNAVSGDEVAPSTTDGVATDVTNGGTGKGDAYLTDATTLSDGNDYALALIS